VTDSPLTPETPDTPDDTAANAAELDELRAEVARLRAEVKATGDTRPLQVQERDTAAAGGRTGWWRPVVVTLLIVIMAILAPLSVVARWAHDEISDTDRYVETVAPLASDPDVQAAAVDRITTAILERLDVRAVTDEAVDALGQTGLPPVALSSLDVLSTPLANAIENLIRDQVTNLVQSQVFADAWEATNREAHAQMVAVLTGEGGGAIETSGTAVRVNLATVIEAVKAALIDRGFALAERIPTINAQFVIFESADLPKVQTGFRVLSALATWLPILALLCLAGAVAVARSRRKAFLAGALALAASMLLLGAGLNIGREFYLDALPAGGSVAAQTAIYDALVWFIRVNLRAILVIALAAAFVAWVSGPDSAARALRSGTTSTIDALRGGGERIGLNTGRFGVALHTYQRPLRIGIIALALLVYVMRDHPSGPFALWLVAITALALLLVALLARPEPASTPSATDESAPPGPASGPTTY
jgi:hypothetical protein